MTSPRTTGAVIAVAMVALLLAPTSVTAQAAQSCGGRAATIVGTEGDDVIRGTDGRDVIVGLGGDDRIIGGRGNDFICGGRGRDRISGGAGKDTLFGGTGNDRLSGGSAADTILGGGGNDRLFGNGGNDTLTGEKGRDRMVADVGVDSCIIDTDDPATVGCEDGNILRLTGSGDAVTQPGLDQSFVVEDDCVRTPIRCRYYAAIIELDGATAFDALSVQAFDEFGDHIVTYGDAGDAYSGVFLFRGRPASLEIDSGGGSWSVTFLQPSALVDGERRQAGSGNTVYRVDRPLRGLVTARVTWTGLGNFAVIGVSPTEGRDLLVNEVRFAPATPPFTTQKAANSGITLIQVLADGGTWNVNLGR